MSVAALAAAGALLCPGPCGSRSSSSPCRRRRGATMASLELWQRRGACWRRVAGPWRALARPQRALERTSARATARRRPGRTGSAPRCTASRRTPACTSRITGSCAATGGTRTRARRRTTRSGTSPAARSRAFGGGSEALWRISPQYRYFAVIEYNAHPVVPGRGSAIFLHVSAGHGTAGCVSLPEAQLVRLLRWLRPAAKPMITIRIE